MRWLLIIFGLFFGCFLGQAQGWEAIDLPPFSPDASDHTRNNFELTALAVASNGDIYVAGSSLRWLDGNHGRGLMYWDEDINTWKTTNCPINSGINIIKLVEVAGEVQDVYIGGRFKGSYSYSVHWNNIAKWDKAANSWSYLGGGITGGSSVECKAIAISGNDVYVGGRFKKAGEVEVEGIAKWNGSNWSALDSGIRPYSNSGHPSVNDIMIEGNDVYVGGHFERAGSHTVNGIARFNGGNWSVVATDHSSNSQISSIAKHDGDIIVTGTLHFPQVASERIRVFDIAKLNGSTWEDLSPSSSGVHNHHSKIIIADGNEIFLFKPNSYINYYYPTLGSRKYSLPYAVYKLIDGHVFPVTRGIYTDKREKISVSAFDFRNGELYVAGKFSYAGTNTANGLAKWGGVVSPPGNILYVDQDAEAGENNGSSWADAYVNLNEAIRMVNKGFYPSVEQIWVAEGEYTTRHPSSFERLGFLNSINSLLFVPNVKIYGGFSGSPGEDVATRDWQVNQTQIVSHEGRYQGALIRGYSTRWHPTLENGLYDGFYIRQNTDNKYINGMVTNGSSAEISNCIIEGNRTALGVQPGSSLTVNNSVIRDNVYPFTNNGGTLELNGCTIENNNRTIMSRYGLSNGVNLSGGSTIINGGSFSDNTLNGIFISYDAELSVDGVNFTNNASGSEDATIFKQVRSNFTGTINITNCTFENNGSAQTTAPIMDMNHFNNGDITFESCEFIGNMALEAAIKVHSTLIPGANKNGSFLINACTFESNTASGVRYSSSHIPLLLKNTRFEDNEHASGGGLLLSGYADHQIVNCTFVHNRATNGRGGAIAINGPAEIINCTITNNTATGGGGGLFNRNRHSTVIKNSIIWQNNPSLPAPATGLDTRNLLCTYPYYTPTRFPANFSHSIIENAITGKGPGAVWNTDFGTDLGGNLSVDPKFITAPTPGAPAVPFDLHLNPGPKAKNKSKGIDAGDSAANSEPTDIEGNPRVQGASIDIGAHEN